MRTYEEHLDGVGGDGPARLRRRGLQRAPHLALRADELAQHHGRLRRAAHAAAQAPDLRQPAAAARPAPAGRGARDARLPVQRPHRLRLRARHPARAQRLQRAAADSRARFEEAWEIIYRAWTEEVFSLRGALLVLSATWPSGRGPCSSRIRRSGCRSPAARRPSSGRARHNIPITPGLVPTRGLREDIIRYYARCLAQHGHRLTPDHLIIQAERLRRRQQGAGGEGGGPLHALLQPDAVQPRQHQRGRARSARRAISARARSTTCGPRTWPRCRAPASDSAT